MSTYRFVTEVSQPDYDAFVKQNKLSHLLQSYNWSQIKKEWDHIHTGVYDENNELVAAGLVLIRKLPMGFTMFYIPRGPILDYENEELVNFYLSSLKKIAKKHRALFIKMDPVISINSYISSEYNENRIPELERQMDTLRKAGALHQGFTMEISQSVQPRFESIVELEENMAEKMPKHTKKRLKEADKRHVEIVHGKGELVDEFARLVELTEQRQKISLRNKEYFQLLMDTYSDEAMITIAQVNVFQLHAQNLKRQKEIEDEIAALPENQKKKRFRLEEQLNGLKQDEKMYAQILDEFGYEDKPIAIAGTLCILYGQTCEMPYAGMDERFKKFQPQYKAYVSNFDWAYQRGAKHFSMGGVEGSLNDGLTKFKDNFSPKIYEYIGEFNLPVNKLLYQASLKAYEKAKSGGQ